MNLLRKILQATQGTLNSDLDDRNRCVEVTFATRDLRIHVCTFAMEALHAMPREVQEDIIAEKILQKLMELASGYNVRRQEDRHSHGNWAPRARPSGINWQPRDTGRLRPSLPSLRPGPGAGEIGAPTGPEPEGTFITREMLNAME